MAKGRLCYFVCTNFQKSSGGNRLLILQKLYCFLGSVIVLSDIYVMYHLQRAFLKKY